MSSKAKPARDTLCMVWDTGEGSEITAGITVYGLAPKGDYSHGPLPMDLWPDGCKTQYVSFVGKRWEMPAWNINVAAWPEQESWTGLLHDMLGSLISAGCAVAWMGTEFEMCSPPDLFVPDSMGGVSAALTADGDFVCTVDLDRPLVDLSDQQMLRLRHYATGLADVE